jgi:cob(I)alamin adenosyltransferase
MDLPLRDDRILGHQGYGLIQLIHGDGKGKTTAGVGQAIRCLGAGKRVAIIFFDKGGVHYSERAVLDTLEGLTYWVTGRDRIDPLNGRFDFSLTEIDRKEAERGLALATDALSQDAFDLVILDEINSTTSLGMLNELRVCEVLAKKHPKVEVILTGRNPPASFHEIAHLVTDVCNQRHYFSSGVRAREGLDY